mmetsp:Transcript_18013/g.55413  ORF Transcript_18013/g.55413 Transcript_18013/m.55413 type:complete len:195 (-) Transcript_18013:72-656(-)
MARLVVFSTLLTVATPFQASAPGRPTTALAYKKTRKEMNQKYPDSKTVDYVLTADAPPYGREGDVLKASRGFARNFLAPMKLGEPASAEIVAAFEAKQAALAAEQAAAYDAAAVVAQTLMGLGDVSVARAAGEDGEVAAVSASDLLQVLAEKSKADLGAAKLTLPAIDGFGDYTVRVQLHKDLKIDLPVRLVEA